MTSETSDILPRNRYGHVSQAKETEARLRAYLNGNSLMLISSLLQCSHCHLLSVLQLVEYQQINILVIHQNCRFYSNTDEVMFRCDFPVGNHTRQTLLSSHAYLSLFYYFFLQVSNLFQCFSRLRFFFSEQA